MGVPSFYKYIRNAYKKNIGLSDTCPNHIDRLYLDFNGIIHTCKEQVLIDNGTEKDIHKSVLTYIQHMIITINPKELLFIAIDGVAPRAKMEQQRQRRYKSCQDRALEPKKKNASQKRDWDSNAITPGTKFMANMDRELYKSEFLKELSNNITVIISNSTCPGEGEQKIYRHIRKTEDGVNVVHGLDADLFMLSILVHPKKIYLYREFEDKPSYVCISQLVNCLKSRNKIWSPKDYVVLAFLMGNDFLPKHYSLNLRQNALDAVLDNYEQIHNELSHDLVIDGKIQKNFLLKLLKQFSDKEDDLVRERAETTAYKNLVRHGHSPEERFYHWPDYHRDIEIDINFGNPGWRERYYQNIEVNESDIQKMCKEYINGLAWNLHYYTTPNPIKDSDQGWYYPYIHAPLLTDLVEYLEEEDNTIDLPTSNKQYTCLEQLAIVLPPQSRHLLPYSWKSLIAKNKSNYPWRFKLDPIGCAFRWECAPIMQPYDEDFLEILKKERLTSFELKRKKKHSEYMVISEPTNTNLV